MSWRKVSLGEILPLRYGKGLPARDRSESGEYAVFSSAGLTGSHSAPLTTGPSVVIGRKGTIGTAYFCPKPVWPIDTTFYVEPTASTDIRFAYYLINSLPLKKMNNDSAVPGLNRAHAESLEVLLPPPSEQRAIAATLGALDDKIESNRRAVGKVQELGDTLFTSAVDERRVISEIATITMGTSPKGDTLNEVGDGVDFYQGTRDFGFRFPSQRIWTTNPIRLARRNDTLMSVRAPVGELNRAVERLLRGAGSRCDSQRKTTKHPLLRHESVSGSLGQVSRGWEQCSLL